MNLTSTLSGQFFLLEKLKPLRFAASHSDANGNDGNTITCNFIRHIFYNKHFTIFINFNGIATYF